MISERNAWVICAGLAAALTIGGMVMQAGPLKPGADPDVDLNGRWAEQAFSGAVDADPPFSFVYGGRHSSAFISGWKREVKDERTDNTKRRRVVTLTDPETHLEVRAVATIYADTAGVDWTLHFSNKGAQDTPILEHLKALDVTVASEPGQQVVLHRLNGGMSAVDDWQPFDQALSPEQRVEFAATNGRSSNVCPFFNLDWRTGGVITAIGWSGQWSASVEQTSERQVHLRVGMQNAHLSLHPGETIRTPRIMQLYWAGGDQYRAYNLWRRTMLSHIVPKINGKTVTPPIVHLSTSFYELNASTEANVLSHLEPIKGLGFEMFWLDAYWTRDGFPNGMGNYGFPIERAQPQDRFPRGLRPISDAAHEAGMGFVVWFEPERVAPGTWLAKEHPEWVISPGGDGSGLFNLGIPEARQYMTDYLNAVVDAYGIDCLRIDYNIDPLPFWQHLNSKDPNRAGIAEIQYVEGLYQMWDDILKAHPRLFIDNCASGGRRIDLETCSRSIPLWRTDGTINPLMERDFDQAAIQNQVMTAGLSRYVPFSTSGMMGATPYWFRSGFNAGIAFCEDCRAEGYPLDLLKQGIAEGKRIRKYYFGSFYQLSDVTTSAEDWCVMQYHRPEEHDGMVVAFRRHQSPRRSIVCDLREIDPERSHIVTQYHTYEPSKPMMIKGSTLRRLAIDIDERPGSVVIEYKEVS